MRGSGYAPPPFRGSRTLSAASHAGKLHRDVKPAKASEHRLDDEAFAAFVEGARVSAFIPARGGEVAGTIVRRRPAERIGHKAALAPLDALPEFDVSVNGDFATTHRLTARQLTLLPVEAVVAPLPPALDAVGEAAATAALRRRRRLTKKLLLGGRRPPASEGDDEASSIASAESVADVDIGAARTAAAAALAAELEFAEDEEAGLLEAGAKGSGSASAAHRAAHRRRAAAAAAAALLRPLVPPPPPPPAHTHREAPRGKDDRARPRHPRKRSAGFLMKQRAAEAEEEMERGVPAGWRSEGGSARRTLGGRGGATAAASAPVAEAATAPPASAATSDVTSTATVASSSPTPSLTVSAP